MTEHYIEERFNLLATALLLRPRGHLHRRMSVHARVPFCVFVCVGKRKRETKSGSRGIHIHLLCV